MIDKKLIKYFFALSAIAWSNIKSVEHNGLMYCVFLLSIKLQVSRIDAKFNRDGIPLKEQKIFKLIWNLKKKKISLNSNFT